jgi:FkbM family methyltransferase
VKPFSLHPPGDYVSDEIRRTGAPFEVAILAELERRLAAVGVIVDAGAHIGNHAAWFAAHLPHTEIHAFEPWPDNLALLRRNTADWPTVRIHPFALSDRGRTLNFMADDNLGHVRADEAGTFTVDALPLDELELRDVSLVKIDVEGHEPQVIAGAAWTIHASHPLILIEDWTEPFPGTYAALLPGYRCAGHWEAHQTYLYEWAA